MKKIILILSVIICFITASTAQVKIGAKAGINIANVTGLTYSDAKVRLGINAGMLAKINLSKKFFVQPELLYAVKGYKFPKTNFSGAGFVNMDYVNIPLLTGYNFTDKFSVVLGPEFGFLLKANSKFDNTNHDVTKNYKKFDMAISLGIAYNLNNKIGIDLRYCYSFINLVEATLTDAMGNVVGKDKQGKNSVFQLGLFYIF